MFLKNPDSIHNILRGKKPSFIGLSWQGILDHSSIIFIKKIFSGYIFF